jgi:hypothetical protein
MKFLFWLLSLLGGALVSSPEPPPGTDAGSSWDPWG